MTDPNSMTGYDAATVEASVALSRYRTCTRALPIAPPAPLVTADGVAVKRYYPDDGGLKAPVREVGEPSPCFGVVLRHFRPDLHPPIVATPLQVTADDVALIAALRKAVSYYRANDWPESDTELLTQAADAIARRAAPAVDETELDRLREALKDIRTRASEASTMPSYRLGQIMAHIDDRARAALNREGIAE